MTNKQAASLLTMLPDSVAKGILQRAEDKQQDVQTIVTELLEKGLRAEAPAMTDLNEFIGSWQDDPEFDEAIAAFEMIDEKLWR